jgi:hypothetical protein
MHDDVWEWKGANKTAEHQHWGLEGTDSTDKCAAMIINIADNSNGFWYSQPCDGGTDAEKVH